MEYSKNYIVSNEYVGNNGLMCITYYPYYMNLCRKDYLNDILGFDIELEATRNIYMDVSQYNIQSFGVLKAGDNFTVTCSIFVASDEKPHFNFKQSAILNNNIISTGIFSVNCVMASKRNN